MTVLTNFPHYPDGVIQASYRGRLLFSERRAGVEVVRSYVFARPNKGFLSRMVNHLSFCLSSALASLRLPRFDVVVTESPPLFLGFSGWLISRKLGAAHVFNVADVWPQSAVEMGALKNRLAIGMAERLETFIYQHSHRVTVVTEGIRKDLLARGLTPDKVVTLTNGVDLTFFQGRGCREAVRRELGLSDKFIVMYAGTHGLAQGLQVVLQAAVILSDDPRFFFVLAGDGAEKQRLVDEAREKRLGNITFLNTWSKARMPELLEAADICLVTLRRLPVFRRALPSKMYEAMAMARPILVSAEGMASELIVMAGCGLSVDPENPEALADAVKRLYHDRAGRARMGRNGRRYVEMYFSREVIADKWEKLLEAAVRERTQA